MIPMNPTITLTVFLFASGLFTPVCAIANYKWFFKTGELMPASLIAMIGKRGARVFFIIVGIACLAWGVIRVVNPPREIPVAFLHPSTSPYATRPRPRQAGPRPCENGQRRIRTFEGIASRFTVGHRIRNSLTINSPHSEENPIFCLFSTFRGNKGSSLLVKIGR